MVPRERFLNKLKELNYSYKGQSKKIKEYKKNGGTHRVHIRKKEDPFADDYVRSTLKQCGCESEEIERFIANNQCNNH